MIASFFQPKSIAVIGVSRDVNSVGSTIFTNINSGGYTKPLYPVNPFITEFSGSTCYPSVLSIPGSVDLAILVVPSQHVPSVLEECGKKAIQSVIIISAGFSEAGPVGRNKEETIKRIAKENVIDIIGPNCLGVIHPHENVNASFSRPKPIKGSIAFLSQSGALGTGLLDIITPKKVGISHFISLGNKAGISEADCIEYLLQDDTTSVIGMYVEELRDATRIIGLGNRNIHGKTPKPIIVLKAGKTKEGNTAVHSHTGSLAGAEEAYHALFKQSRILEVDSMQEFINTLVSFSENPIPKTNSTVILTNAGGPGILATDMVVSHKVHLHTITNHHNPWDLLGDAQSEAFTKALDELESDETIGSIVGIVTPQTVTEIEDTANAFCMHKKRTVKPIAVSFMGDGVMNNGNTILTMGGVPHSKYPEQAAQMVTNLHAFKRYQETIDTRTPHMETVPISSTEIIHEQRILETLASIGITIPPFVYADGSTFTSVSLTNLSDKIAVKLVSKELTHKTEVGAIRLHVPKNDAYETAREMVQSVSLAHKEATIDGILFMDMVDTQEGLECIIGCKRVPNLGQLVMVGIGGIYVEVLKDISFRFAPMSEFDARETIQELKSYKLFEGVRGKKPLDINALCKTLVIVSEFVYQHPEISELDINPIVVMPNGAIALDARITLD